MAGIREHTPVVRRRVVSDAPVAIRARNLSKVYRIYQSPVHALKEAITGKSRHIRRVALDRVDLEVRRGEIIGVLGRNGAGKSTLLKLIAGTLKRTEGDLDVYGRISAILELGSGFHPEYTGRENIYMGGMCLGMSRREVDSKVEAIIEFSELREVIDQPFKTYSTGMQARLTFSVAISVDPDILIVDEALSVGDARFQLKCSTRLQQFRERAATVLLVSHDSNAITTLCDRAMILEDGRVYAEGDPKQMTIAYHSLLFGEQKAEAGLNIARAVESSLSQEPLATAELPAQPFTVEANMRYGTREARLVDYGILDRGGHRIYMVLDCDQDIVDLSCGFSIKDRRGTVLWGATNISQTQTAYKARASSRLIIAADCTMWLSAGEYFVTLGAAHLADGAKIDFAEDAIGFKVIGPEGIFTTSVVNLQTTFNIECQTAEVERNR
jgi:lipopolysaccharide transport system ATP-binding protein